MVCINIVLEDVLHLFDGYVFALFCVAKFVRLSDSLRGFVYHRSSSIPDNLFDFVFAFDFNDIVDLIVKSSLSDLLKCFGRVLIFSELDLLLLVLSVT